MLDKYDKDLKILDFIDETDDDLSISSNSISEKSDTSSDKSSDKSSYTSSDTLSDTLSDTSSDTYLDEINNIEIDEEDFDNFKDENIDLDKINLQDIDEDIFLLEALNKSKKQENKYKEKNIKDKLSNIKNSAINYINDNDIENVVDENDIINRKQKQLYLYDNIKNTYEENYEDYIKSDFPKFDDPNYILTEPDYLESLNDLPKWNKVMLFKIRNRSLIEYPLLKIDIKNNSIVVYKHSIGLIYFNIHDYIIYYKRPKLTTRQMMELLLKNIDSGEIIINKKS